ncbi:nuclear transport factor 2 family protein [bacterium]|nr:nuclear transport factor 2 family protein [bacterium]
MSDVYNVGKKLVELCQAGKGMEALDSLYDENIVSVEAMDMPNIGREQKGLDAIKQKNEWWYNAHEVHTATVDGPYPNGNQFAVNFKFDVTNKESGQRFEMSEVAMYTVENNKIVREEFFYTTDNDQ